MLQLAIHKYIVRHEALDVCLAALSERLDLLCRQQQDLLLVGGQLSDVHPGRVHVPVDGCPPDGAASLVGFLDALAPSPESMFVDVVSRSRRGLTDLLRGMLCVLDALDAVELSLGLTAPSVTWADLSLSADVSLGLDAAVVVTHAYIPALSARTLSKYGLGEVVAHYSKTLPYSHGLLYKVNASIF